MKVEKEKKQIFIDAAQQNQVAAALKFSWQG
jgi:hypothetical protein